jgi:hypothetical protein
MAESTETIVTTTQGYHGGGNLTNAIVGCWPTIKGPSVSIVYDNKEISC